MEGKHGEWAWKEGKQAVPGPMGRQKPREVPFTGRAQVLPLGWGFPSVGRGEALASCGRPGPLHLVLELISSPSEAPGRQKPTMEMAEERCTRRRCHLLVAMVQRGVLPLCLLSLVICVVFCCRHPAQQHLLRPSEVTRRKEMRTSEFPGYLGDFREAWQDVESTGAARKIIRGGGWTSGEQTGRKMTTTNKTTKPERWLRSSRKRKPEVETEARISPWLAASGESARDLSQTVKDWLWCSPSRPTQRLLGASQSWEGWLGWKARQEQEDPHLFT